MTTIKELHKYFGYNLIRAIVEELGLDPQKIFDRLKAIEEEEGKTL